jgi:acyl-CoA synthetase (NDP forming)
VSRSRVKGMQTAIETRDVYSHATLARLIAPRSIAVVGASPTAGSFGFNARANLKAFEGQVYLVNPRYREIDGAKCYPDIRSLPAAPDCAVLAVNRDLAEPVLEQCAERGVGGAIMFASGYAETGRAEFAQAQQRISALAARTGLRVIGPNCIGVMNYARGFAVSFTSGLDLPRPSGPAIGIASQSGAMGNAVVQASRMGVPFSHLLTAGNSCDVDTADYVAYLADDPACSVIVCLFEGLRTPRRLLQAGERARQQGKPLIVCKIATSRKGAESALSHTGALAGGAEGYKALFDRMDAVVVEDLEELAETAAFFLKARRIPSGGAAVLGASGGFCVIGVDKAETHGVELPLPSTETVTQVRSLIPEFGVAANPCDMTAQNTPATIKGCYEAFLADPAYDTLVTPYTYAWDRGVSRITDLDEVARRFGKVACLPWTTAWTTGPGAAEAQRCENVALFRSMQSCFRTLGAWYRRAAKLKSEASQRDEAPSNRLSAPAQAVVARSLAASEGTALTEVQGKAVLRQYGIAVVEERIAASAAQAVEAASALGYPVAMKILSPDILHKTEAGGVKLGLMDAEQVRAAFDAMLTAGGSIVPTPRIEGVLLQPMVPSGVEVVVGARVDPVFGPMVLVGMGGVLVELLRDSVVELAPVTPKQAHAMLGRLKAQALLDGFRGASPVDRERLADIVCRVSELAHDLRDTVCEIDINPLICGPDRIVAVDALIVKRALDSAA